MRKWILAGSTVALMATCAVAQIGERLSTPCRQEVVRLCGINREAIRGCLTQKIDQLSDSCRAEIRERVAARGGLGRNTVAKGGEELSYGNEAKQKLDYFAIAGKSNVPLVVFIHGGGWSIGDKKHGTGTKYGYYNGLGFAFASLNYRLVPNVKPSDQATDIARAISYLRKNAAKLGFDPNRIFIMGHSAGAHLAALVGSDTRYLDQAGVPVSAIKGAILLDGAGYDVAAQMQYKGNKVQGMYNAAFGSNPAVHATLSPVTHARAPNIQNWLILHVESRPDATAQSQALGKILSTNGAAVAVKAVPDSTHMSVNQDAGKAGSFVGDEIASFLARLD